jgi:limonene-1,2-epoxide hydrolase
MATDPSEIVTRFISLLSAKNIDSAAELVSDDFEYDNVPIGKVHGPDGMRATLTGFFAACESLDWVIVRQTSSGDASNGTVLNERDDRLKIHGQWRTLPVAGVFEIRDGKITLWRDYFDRTTLGEAMAPPA